MPRKNKKAKISSDTKTNAEAEDVQNEPEKNKGLCLPLDKKLKLQIKKQKKKEKKLQFLDSVTKKFPDETETIPEIEWESTENMEEQEEGKATVVNDEVTIVEIKVLSDNHVEAKEHSPELSQEEEKNLKKFLKTFENIDNQAGRHEGDKRDMEAQIQKRKLRIETIPEDLFEEFIENEEKIQTRETTKVFPRTSPKHSPVFRRKEPIMCSGNVIVSFPPKVFYNYQGISYSELPRKTICQDDREDSIVVINSFSENDLYPYRRLDVILEESSDMSDGSGYSEKRRTWDRGFGPKIGEKFPTMSKTDKDGATAFGIRAFDSCNFQPVVVEMSKMSDDVTKIELVESESEGDYEIDQSETSKESCEVKIIDAEIGECAKFEDISLSTVKSGYDKSPWPMKSALSETVKLLEEDSESWRSSLNPEICDGGEADAESESEPPKTVTATDTDEDSKMEHSETAETISNDIEIFVTNYLYNKNEQPGWKTSGGAINVLPLEEENPIRSLQTKYLTEVKTREVEGNDSSSINDLLKPASKPIIYKENENNINVKKMADAIKEDMDRILMTKIRMIQSKPNGVDENVKNNLDPNSSCESQICDSSSYENIPKVKEAKPMVKVTEDFKEPELLSNLAEKKVLSLPYGKFILKKIGLGRCCSNDSENTELHEERYTKTRNGKTVSSSGEDAAKSTPDKFHDNPIFIEFNYGNPKSGQTEKWYGMRTALPAVLVGLSPSQKKVYQEKQKKAIPDETEAARLLDLHKKFLERRSYHEPHYWSRERNIVIGSEALPNVSITEISDLIVQKKSALSTQNERANEEVEAKEKKFSQERLKQIGGGPENRATRSVGNENRKYEASGKYYGVEDRRREINGSETAEQETVSNTRTQNIESVGKSRLLAFLQNAISDDEFVPELNADTSINSDGKIHEISVVQEQATMACPREEAKGTEVTAKKKTPEEESVSMNLKTFQDFWCKEKSFCLPGENAKNNARLSFRPKTICCEKETDLMVNEPKFVKKVSTVKATSQDKVPEAEKENLVVTENLPAVSELIRAFEEPQRTKPQKEFAKNSSKATQIQIDNERYNISKRGDIALIQNDCLSKRKTQKEKRKSMPATILSEEEIFKQRMYDEYMSKLAERIERRQQKVIRVSQSNEIECPEDTKFHRIENEFISKVKERKGKLGIPEDSGNEEVVRRRASGSLEKKCQEFRKYWEREISDLETDLGERTGTESGSSKRSSFQLMLDTNADADGLPDHLRELLLLEGEEFPDFFQDFRRLKKRSNLDECCRCKLRKNDLLTEIDEDLTLSKGFLFGKGVWSPAQKSFEEKTEVKEENIERKKLEDEPIPPVWTPKASPVLEKKEFRPVNFESPTLPRKNYIQEKKRESSVPPPWQQPGGDQPPELAKSPSSPALSLPKAPNPTVTLLQKAREGYLPKGALYLNSEMKESPAVDEVIIERLDTGSLRSEPERTRKVEIAPKKISGIGPTTKEGIPLVLRSEVTDENKEKWYKRMYDSLHKYGKDDDFVTVKYRTSPSRKGIYSYQRSPSSGYLSEPETLNYDRSANKYITLDRKRVEKDKENECISVTLPRSRASPPRKDFNVYKNQPGRIEDYEPGHSSISEVEANKWWDEVLEIFDREEEKSRPIHKVQSPRSFTNYASGYISDPQYVYKRSEEELQSPPSSEEQKEAYRIIQKGGEIPLRGLRKPAPERPKETLGTEFEYFPLSPTLTRIRVHKQNITPLSDFPFYLHPFPLEKSTVNYPGFPFGVCNSFSQIQIFPSTFPNQSTCQTQDKTEKVHSTESGNQKFSVHLQNISDSNDYIRIVPKPRQRSKKCPIYANIPSFGRSCSPDIIDVETGSSAPVNASEENKDVALIAKADEIGTTPVEEKPKPIETTFFHLKRVVPSITATSSRKLTASKIPAKILRRKSVEVPKKKEVVNLKPLAKKSPSGNTESISGSGEKRVKIKELKLKPALEKLQKKERKKVSVVKQEPGKKVLKTKVPLSESVQREKSLLKTSKSLSDSSRKSSVKSEIKKPLRSLADRKLSKENKERLSRFASRESGTSSLNLKGPEISKAEAEKDTAMSTIYETVGSKHRVGSDMTEIFRSRSFSPDVRRKIIKPVDMNKPIPPKRKQSKNSPTLKMWSKMMVSYPNNHRSRLEAFDSNVKFLSDKIKRKLGNDKEEKSEFGDDVETVRTVKKNKNGTMSIQTNRYVKLSRPTPSGLLSSRSTYPDIQRRRLVPESKSKSSSDLSKPQKSSSVSALTRPLNPADLKNKQKDLDTLVKSSTTYSVRNRSRQEEEKGKSVKVTVAISSKGKELLRKTAGLASPLKKSNVSKSSSSPCPSVSSLRSGASLKSLLSDRGSSASSRDRISSPQPKFTSPNSSTSRVSSLSRSNSPGSATNKPKLKQPKPENKLTVKKPKETVSSLDVVKSQVSKLAKTKEVTKVPTVTKASGKRLQTQVAVIGKPEPGKEVKKKVRTTTGAVKVVSKKPPEEEKLKNEVIEGRDLVRTDSFFQNLFLRSSNDQQGIVEDEKTSSVWERARRYQNRLNWLETYRSEPSLSLVTFYLNQKRPVSHSKFKAMDREENCSRSLSPLGSFHSENFYLRLKRFDSMSQFGDGLTHWRDYSPESKGRSSSEPPMRRSQTNSPDSQAYYGKYAKASVSDASSPASSRSPSCRRIQSHKSSVKVTEGGSSLRSRSLGDVEENKPKLSQQSKSVSSLSLSNLSDHTEYQAYVLELMHSKRKCERFRELHKFYSNLERMGKLEETASMGDLRPRLRNEDIIDFDRWKKIRIKERAEAELKTLIDNLVRIQKEKGLLFRATDVDAIRWKGDRGLRIKEKSVEDLKERFSKHSQKDLDSEANWKKEMEATKDYYKSLWRGNSIVDVASNLNNTLSSRRGRPITSAESEKLEKASTRIGKEYGYSLKAWKSLSNEQIHNLKDQLSAICAQEARRKPCYETPSESYEICVPKDSGVKSPGESSLQVRCSSALSKSQTFTPTVKRKEEIRKGWKKAESITGLPSCWKSEGGISLPQLPWRDEEKMSNSSRSHAESEGPKSSRYSIARSKSVASSRPLSENEKKRLSMSLSREVIEKMSKASGKGPLFPRETMGALAAAGSHVARPKLDLVKAERSKVLSSSARGAGKEFDEEKCEIEAENTAQNVELGSGSGSSETSTRTVITKDSKKDVLKKVQYFEDLHQSGDELYLGSGARDDLKDDTQGFLESAKTKDVDDQKGPKSLKTAAPKEVASSGKVKRNTMVPSSSLENLNDYFGQQKQYATSPLHEKAVKQATETPPKREDFFELRNFFDDVREKRSPVRFRSSSPGFLRSGSSSESLFSSRSRSLSPDPTKYYRAYLRMVKCGAVRKLCNKFESWEDLLSLSSDKDFWLPPPPRRFASDPELTRDLLKRFGTDPTKVTIRGQEVGDVRWLRTKFEKNLCPSRSRSRFRRIRSPSSAADRFMPRINVISKTAELQMQGLNSPKTQSSKPKYYYPTKGSAPSPEGYRSLIDYTKDHGGYYYTGEVEKLRRKFERLQEAEKLSILGQMYTSAPDVNELRDISPYLECSWVAHRHPRVTKAVSPVSEPKRQKTLPRPRPHSSSPVRPKQLSSILKPSHSHSEKPGFSDQKFDPSIHRPKFRYQPDREGDRRHKESVPALWRHWNRPTVTFKESVSFKAEPEVRDISPESPRKYVESEVTIHYKSPVRSEAKEVLSEEELARRQAESMKRIYKEERRRKYLQELQDMNSRRHTDNFTPSQKSPISLNRYDDFPLDTSVSYGRHREHSLDPIMVARGLYDFVGRRPRELAFRRGDIIFIIRKLDKNWCEGELNGVVGLFPLSYVEVIPYNEINMRFGRARAKYDFVPQTSMELSARKGDVITLIRKIDENWFEGRIGDRTGIIPASYCHVLAMPQASRVAIRSEKVSKPVAAPAAHSLIHNGSSLSSKHYYTPHYSGLSSPGRSNTFDSHPSADMLIDEALSQLDEEFDLKRSTSKPLNQPLNVRVNPRPEPALYQVLFNHVPNNDDELELVQGETVTVVEKCGDGWYIGSKTSDGKLGIFPGTHVRRIGPEFV